MTFYLHSCLVYPSRKLFEGFAGESSKKKFKPFNFKMRFGVCLSKLTISRFKWSGSFGQNRARRSGSVKKKLLCSLLFITAWLNTFKLVGSTRGFGDLKKTRCLSRKVWPTWITNCWGCRESGDRSKNSTFFYFLKKTLLVSRFQK